MQYTVSILTTMGITVIAALGLNLITGFCGQISLGHAAFIGVGAYAAALLTKAGVPFLLALPPAMALAAALGIIVGIAALRVREDFLAITTMGVNLLFVGVVRQQNALGGELGVSGIAGPGMSMPAYAAFVLALAALVALFCLWVQRSWMGRVFNAIAEDEDTTRVIGIAAPRFKLWAFALGSGLAGLAGALLAHHLRIILPDSFALVESIALLSMVVFGGIGSVWGVIAAAALLSALPQWFQVIGNYKLLVYGALLFLMMRFCPDGIAGALARLARRR
jgi:branched-chain amino acid transport system permease protein